MVPGVSAQAGMERPVGPVGAEEAALIIRLLEAVQQTSTCQL
jgi:hypothetical protein